MTGRAAAMVGVLTAMALLLSACYTTKVIAPPEKNIKLASESAVCSELKSRRIWYILWGLVPLSDETTARDLEAVASTKGKISKVKIEDKITFVDGLIGIITGMITIYPKSVIIYTCE